MPELKPSRRRFLGTAAAGLAIPRPATAASANRVIGANDRINIGFIGVGGADADISAGFMRAARSRRTFRSSPSATSTRSGKNAPA